jgi:hypothetical protein
VAKRVVQAGQQFDNGVDNQDILLRVLTQLSENLAVELHNAGRMTGDIELTLYLEGRQTHHAEIVLGEPTANIRHVAETVGDLLATLAIKREVVEVCLALGGSAALAPQQLSLFDRDPVPHEQLRRVLRDLIARYGEDTFYWFRLVDLNARLPERRFRLERAM